MMDAPKYNVGPSIPQFTILREVEDGRGKVSITYSRQVFGIVLQAYGVKSAADLSQDIVRQMHVQWSPIRTSALMDEIEDERPGSVELVSEQEGSRIDSKDLGYDLMKRLVPDPSDGELLFDPTYSPVEVELNVFDVTTRFGRQRVVTSNILRMTLEPPDLA